MIGNEKRNRGLRLLEMTRYAQSISKLSDKEIREELVHYARKNFGVSEGTLRSYVETVLARMDRDSIRKEGTLDNVCGKYDSEIPR